MRKPAAAVVMALLAMAPASAADVKDSPKAEIKAPPIEFKAMITTAMKDAVDELRPQFEKRSSYTVSITYGPSGGLARRLKAGEPTDMILIAAPELDALMVLDKVLPGSSEISRTGIGIAVKKGAPRPEVSTPDALRRALLAAKSVAHTDPAGGGITAMHLLRMFTKLGVASEVAAKTRLAAGGPNGRVSTLVANGEAEIGFQQVSELMSNPGVDVIGMLPHELQQITDYRAAITVAAKALQADGAREFIRFLTFPEAIELYKKKGLAVGM
jgi:molybdate transport system substrate-binding protein